MSGIPSNIMALLAAAQTQPGRGPMIGPIPAQNPTPGFRPPGTMGVSAPGMQPQQNPFGGAGAQGLMGAMQRMHPGAAPSTTGATMGAPESNGLGGAVAGVQGLQPNPDGSFTPPPMPTNIGQGQGGQPSFMDFLTGKMRSLFGPSASGQ